MEPLKINYSHEITRDICMKSKGNNFKGREKEDRCYLWTWELETWNTAVPLGWSSHYFEMRELQSHGGCVLQLVWPCCTSDPRVLIIYFQMQTYAYVHMGWYCHQVVLPSFAPILAALCQILMNYWSFPSIFLVWDFFLDDLVVWELRDSRRG